MAEPAGDAKAVRTPDPGGVRLVLASASPRRLDLLRLAGLHPEVRPARVEERPEPGEDPFAYVVRMARVKAGAVRRSAGEVVLGADTAVVLDGETLGKPRDARGAAATLARLAGRSHRVATGVAVIDPAGALDGCLAVTEVWFAPLSDAAIRGYVATGEPLDKAGAYGIQGRAAAFVERLDGSWTNVVGLPLVESLALLRWAGVPVP